MLRGRGLPARPCRRNIHLLQRQLRFCPVSARQASTKTPRTPWVRQWAISPSRPSIRVAVSAAIVCSSSIGSSRQFSLLGWTWGSSAPSPPPSATAQPVVSPPASSAPTATAPPTAVSTPPPAPETATAAAIAAPTPTPTSALPTPTSTSALPTPVSTPAQTSTPVTQDSVASAVGSSNGDLDYTNIPVDIGFFKECGLEYGTWNPAGKIAWLLEHVHVYSGFPWWASIVTTALVVRLAFFPLFIKQSEMTAKMLAIKPEMNKVKDALQAATRDGDRMGQRLALLEMQKLKKVTGLKYTWMYIPPLVNMVVGFATFRFFRRATELDVPIPGWETGGLLWVTDLTLPDPLYLTPIVFGGILHLFVRLGGDSGAGAEMQAWLKPVTLYVMPVALGTVMLFFPVAMQLAFLVSLLAGCAQTLLLRNPRFRDRFGLPPILDANKAALEKKLKKESTAPQYADRLNLVATYKPPTAEELLDIKPQSPGVVARVRGAIKSLRSSMGDTWAAAKESMAEQVAKYRGEPIEDAASNRRKRSKTFMKNAEEYEQRRRQETRAERSMRF